ncbi:uncharacterized protein EAE98_005222 [Botrytis deweyae]|uniref:Nucleolar protein Dnt1-like N-terminal domain-containing protein n=1 Tax=Botrytis deweyae TaxID=2478750 RepID=A0ABQ7IN95_9HELO|nr:uncharacterized protein EAE98_005222 [Botrytis deweyae]KAF7929303.1 hypothetical protein EAE98_005222 [Botrytis deweyae]
MMNSLIDPPASPGFSLRVKVFTPDAAEENDRPIRCFRVITSPNITIREFCTEASRVHEINYGQPLAIKKCMDDELFDVTQNDLIGPLFNNMSTIRIIKAPNKPNVRDSLPPTSALRFNPMSVLGQKRDRSPINGTAESFWNPQKRQRTAIDPDKPIPSRELESYTGGRLEGIPENPEATIPDSQQSAILGHEDGDNDVVPNVREDSPMISDTRTPSSPLPVERRFVRQSHAITNYITKLSTKNTNAQPNSDPKELVSPFKEPPPRKQGTPKDITAAKSASYHIQRATDRGRSVSTTATSPMANEPQLPPHPNSSSIKKPKTSETIARAAKSGNAKNRSPRNEGDIYDDFGSDSEEIKVPQSKLKLKKSSSAGLPGLERLANSPSNQNRHLSKNSESVSTPYELPLTPKSRIREEELRKKKESEEAAKEARTAAAKAAEERRRESEREAVAAKAERMRKEKSEERKAEEKQRLATRKQKEDAALLAQKLKDEKEKLRKQIEEDDRIEMQKAEEEAAKKAKEEFRKSKAPEGSKRTSETPQESRKGTPVNKRSTPSTILPRQSSTPHYPRGKKSSLKTSRSSESVLSSSPGAPAPKDTSLEAQMPLPSKGPRRVSFDLDKTNTPIKPQHQKTVSVDTPKEKTTPALTSSQTPAPNQTPIPLPKTFKRPGPDRSATPVRQLSLKPSAMSQPPLIAGRASSVARSATPKPIPQPALKIISSEKIPLERKTITPEPKKATASTPGRPVPVKEKPKSPPKSAEIPLPPSSDSSSSEDSDSGEEVTVKQEPKRSISPPNRQIEESNDPNDQSDEDVEMGENQSSPRDSRSPVVFHSNAPSGDERKSFNKHTQDSASSSEDESSDEEESGDDTSDKDNDTKVKTEIKETQDSSEDEGEGGSDDEDVKMPDAPAQRLSPELPSHARRNMVSPIKTTNQRKNSSSDEDNTQDEVDQQLTSDIFEAQGPSFSSPLKRPIIRPTIGFGASLSSLNSQKGAMFKPRPSSNGQLAKSKLQLSSQLLNKEFSESEDDESSSDDSSDDDDVPVPASSKIPSLTQSNGLVASAAIAAAAAKRIKDARSDSDSDSDNSSDDAMEQARKSLMAQVNQYGMSASQNTLPQGSQVSVNGGAQKENGKGGAVLGKTNGNAKNSRSAGKEFAKKGKDRITNGYDFKSYGSFN